jgi:hypothetical protein
MVGLITKTAQRHLIAIRRPIRYGYQPPTSDTFFSQQISHQQSASSTFLSE